jgi:zinc and cadmium transporter
MNVWGYSLLSVIAVSLISLMGISALLLHKDVKKITFLLVSFAVGGLFGDAFIHLLPESFEEISSNLAIGLYILLGIMVFFVLEKFLRWRHCHLSENEEHVHVHPVVTMNLVGDGVHNMIDGMVIGASYLISTPLGLTTTLAIVLHEIPQEMGDFGVLVHGGLSVKKALVFNFLSALTAVIGTILSLTIGPHVQGYTLALVPITAGGFIYIAGSDLLPELQHEVKIGHSLLQFTMILLGIGIMALLVILE